VTRIKDQTDSNNFVSYIYFALKQGIKKFAKKALKTELMYARLGLIFIFVFLRGIVLGKKIIKQHVAY